jgi:hypothetical protein
MLLFLFPGHSFSVNAHAAPADPPTIVRRDTTWVQEVVDDYLARLSMSSAVRVSVVEQNQLVASVETSGEGGPFTLSLQENFLAALSEDELRAVIAHELGHVWIFTHHPYLQTERLANDIAMRLVTRDTLVTVYQKLWQSQGTKGDLVRFVGD